VGLTLTGDNADTPLPPPLAQQPPPAPPADPNQQRMERAFEREQDAVGRAERSMAQEERLSDERAKTLAPLRQRSMDIAAQPLPQPPEPQKPPAAPKRQDPHDDETWLMASALLGSLAGAFTRRHQTNALAAFTGAMEGYQEGSRTKFDQNMKIWEAENKRTQETNATAMEHYRGILENRKLSMDQMAIELQMAAAAYDDQAMATAARTKNAMVIAQLYDKQAEAAGRMKTSADNLSLKYHEMQQKEKIAALKAAGITTPGQFQDRVKAIIELRGPPLSGRWAEPIMEEVYRQAPNYDTTAYAEKQRIVNAFANGIEGRQVGSLNVAISHLEVLKGLGEALENHDMPRINQFGNAISTELGYPAPTSFDAVKEVVSAEIMKSIVPGGGGVIERRSLADKVAASNSPAQLNGVITAWESLMGGQMEGLKHRYEKGTKLHDWDEFLLEQTKKALTTPLTPETISQSTRRVVTGEGREPYRTPAQSVLQGKRGVDTNWNPFGAQPLGAPQVHEPPAPGWKVEEIGPQSRAEPSRYFEAARNFARGGLSEVMKGEGVRMPEWSNRLSDFFQRDAVNTAVGMATPVGRMERFSWPVRTNYGKTIDMPITVNPSKSAIQRELAVHGDVRAIRAPDGSVYMWPANEAMHVDIADNFDLPFKTRQQLQSNSYLFSKRDVDAIGKFSDFDDLVRKIGTLDQVP
jgi:hypothetical protein